MEGESQMRSPLLIYLLLVITMVFWGSAFVVSKISVGAVQVQVAAFLRFAFGTVFCFILLFGLRLRNPQVRLVPRGSWWGTFNLGVIGVAIYNLLFFGALAFTKASDGSVIIPTLSPVITVLLAAVFLNERLGWQRSLGLTSSLVGAFFFFLAVSTYESGMSDRMIGDLLFLAGAFCWAVYTLMSKKILGKVDPLLLSAYSMLFGTLVLGLIALPDMVTIEWGSYGNDFWLYQIYLGIFPTVLASWFYYVGVKGIGPSRAVMFMNLVPIFGLLLSAIILDEWFQPIQFIGSGFMLLGVWMVNRRGVPKKELDRRDQERVELNG
ncbi:DMT family transporter [Ammoniphilus sp. CFH 90114]|uniref:DMT family transporter n=1 Tax=Ammoniphilus sp. CFH 90114 TaxID=2493665 RepID=UPI00100E5997|nr:DMT family transporter [Ammoniphilus sp. CFH 90114]RXT06557.1 DMT family transporter [Ammoniphilus sp. CFH 90114]